MSKKYSEVDEVRGWLEESQAKERTTKADLDIARNAVNHVLNELSAKRTELIARTEEIENIAFILGRDLTK